MRKARVRSWLAGSPIIMHAMLRDEDGVRIDLSPRIPGDQEARSSSRKERRPREGADDGADSVARSQPMADCDFNRAALHPAYPIKCRTST